jgi:hypothetical protein
MKKVYIFAQNSNPIKAGVFYPKKIAVHTGLTDHKIPYLAAMST